MLTAQNAPVPDARVVFTVTGATGERTVPAEEFFLGVYMTAAGPGELLTKITVPAGRSDGFASVPIGVDGTCIVNAAATVNGGVRVALGCVAATPVVRVHAGVAGRAVTLQGGYLLDANGHVSTTRGIHAS